MRVFAFRKDCAVAALIIENCCNAAKAGFVVCATGDFQFGLGGPFRDRTGAPESLAGVPSTQVANWVLSGASSVELIKSCEGMAN